MMKRFICLLLTLILAVSCCAVAASAADEYRDPAEWQAEPLMNPRLNPALHPKLTLDLLNAIEAAAPQDTEQNLKGLHIVVYFNEAYKAIHEIPSWPNNAVNSEYTEYVFDLNQQLTREAYGVTSLFSLQYVDYYMPGCIIIHDVNLDELLLAERSERVRRIDVFDARLYDGKLDRYTRIAMNVFDADDYIPVWVGNAAYMKTVADMPSWPTGRNHNTAETQAQLMKARAEYSAYEKEFNDAFIAAAFDGIDAAVFDGYGFMALAAVKLSDLETLAARDCVRYIEYSENQISEPDIEPEPVDVPEITYYERKLRSQYDITNTDALDFELLYLHDADGAVDWALVRAFRYDLCYPAALHSAVVGGRRLTASALGWAPFEFAFGIYDAAQDRFFDLTEINFGDYDGLYAVWKNLELTTPYGRIYEDSPYFDGDADGDGLVSILDATRIQRKLAGLCTKFEIVETSADVDRDGSVTILDATRIQRYKASICNLDGSPYDPDRGVYLYYPNNG